MNKIALGIALFSTSVFAVSADNNCMMKNTSSSCLNTECATQAQPDTKDSKNKKSREFSSSKLFIGISLSDEQKTKLNDLKNSNNGKDKKEAKEKFDKDKFKNMSKEDKVKLREEMMNKALESKKENLGKIKSILTPDQYLQFLENAYIYGNEIQERPRFTPQDRNGMNRGADRPMNFSRNAKKGAKRSSKGKMA